jgi:hypothetical protein
LGNNPGTTKALDGKRVVIRNPGKPLVWPTSVAAASTPRKIGTAKGDFEVPENFDALYRITYSMSLKPESLADTDVYLWATTVDPGFETHVAYWLDESSDRSRASPVFGRC